jgi:hypothetical protein
MGRKLSVGILAASLLMSGLLVGVSFGSPTGIAEPRVITLYAGDGLGPEVSEGIDSQLGCQALDADDDVVGAMRWNVSGEGANWHATIVYVIKDAELGRGTIVATGIFRGFNGERLAVTGGTGAYENVRGSVQLTVEQDTFTHTLHLIP